jgi:hypothetical protein
MRTARAQADAILAGYQRIAKAAGVDKARAKTADARAARLVQHRQKQGAGNDVSCAECPLVGDGAHKSQPRSEDRNLAGCWGLFAELTDVIRAWLLFAAYACICMQPQQKKLCGAKCVSGGILTLQGQVGAGARPVLPPQPAAARKRGRPPKQPMPGLAPPLSGSAAGGGALGKEAEDRRVRVWWPDDKVWAHPARTFQAAVATTATFERFQRLAWVGLSIRTIQS